MQFSLTIVLVLVCVLLVDSHIHQNGENARRKEARRQGKENNRQLKNYQKDQNKNTGSYYGRGYNYDKRSIDEENWPFVVNEAASKATSKYLFKALSKIAKVVLIACIDYRFCCEVLGSKCPRAISQDQD